jgi:hypothetical protein
MMRRLLSLALLSLAVAGSSATAQSITDFGVRVAPQFHSYDIKAPSNTKISEFSLPMFVLFPINSQLSFDVGSSYARAQVDQTNNGKSTSSTISGLTDTQIRANYTIGNDAMVLTAGVNIPTGQSTVDPKQTLAASLIGSDFLAFPISNMGTGLGGTGGVAFARPVGDWNVGAGLSMRHATQYDPFDLGGGAVLHYQPGNEYRVRGGVDRALGTGRISLGLTYSTFGNDNLSGSIYNTGNRWLSQVSVNNTLGRGEVVLTGWNLFRTAGTLADSSYLGHEDISNVALSYAVSSGSMVIEPNVEGRMWTQYGGVPTSAMGTVGVRASMTVMGFSVLPSVGYSLGKLASQDNSVNTTASLTGLHATLAIRLR